MTDGIRWDVLVIGHLSRNKFWGESDGQAYREPLCTCTLIRTGEQNIVVDPACGPQDMAAVLDRRAGLGPADIGTVFLTHFHGDHRAGVDAFPAAEVCIGAKEKHVWEQALPQHGPDRELLDRARPVEGSLAPGIELLQTPGHTLGHVSLQLMSSGLSVVIAGDAAMTRDFFYARDWYFNTVDSEQAVQSIEAVARIADIVVPGHEQLLCRSSCGWSACWPGLNGEARHPYGSPRWDPLSGFGRAAEARTDRADRAGRPAS